MTIGEVCGQYKRSSNPSALKRGYYKHSTLTLKHQTHLSFEAQIFYDYTCSVITSLNLLYVRVFNRAAKKFWKNHTYSMARRVYYEVNFDMGWAEYYFPTFPEGNILNWHKVNVLVLPELNQETFDSEILRLAPKLSSRENWPPGPVDSQTIFIVARRPTRGQSERVRLMGRRGMMKTRRVWNAPNCIAVPIISENPKEAAAKILKWIENFWRKRIIKFCEKIHAAMWDIIEDSQSFIRTFYYLTLDYNIIIEGNRRLFPHLGYMLHAFIGQFRVLNDYLRDLVKEAEMAEAARKIILKFASEIAERIQVNPSLIPEVWRGIALAAAATPQPAAIS